MGDFTQCQLASKTGPRNPKRRSTLTLTWSFMHHTFTRQPPVISNATTLRSSDLPNTSSTTAMRNASMQKSSRSTKCYAGDVCLTPTSNPLRNYTQDDTRGERLEIKGRPVMEQWEETYMEELAR